MNPEREQPVEARLEQRVSQLFYEINSISQELLRNDGLSERALAGYLSVFEYINRMIRESGAGLNREEQERFIAEIQQAIRILAHGLTTGDGAERTNERKNIANGQGELSRAFDKALTTANGTGRRGPSETQAASEVKL